MEGNHGDVTSDIVTENYVKVELPKSKKKAELLKYHNPKLALMREAVLTTLLIESSSCDQPLVCLDASTGSGIAGLQWKKNCVKKVHVVTACTETEFIKANSALTGIQCCDWLLDPSHVTGQWPVIGQNENEIFVSPFHPNVVLRQEAFDFIFLHPNTSLALYTDSVFSNIRQNGVACFLCSNIVSQCFRSPQLVLRQFGSHVQKTEYVKELSVRVVISDIVRAAARYQKGVEVLYTMCIEDHFLVVTRATKNNQQAVSCMENCCRLLHCLMCEERVVYPPSSSPLEKPYSLLPCDCKKSNPGKTAVILGPLWTGNIFSVNYLRKLLTKISENNQKSKLCSLVPSILSEAECRCESVGSFKMTESSKDNDMKCQYGENKTQDGSEEPAVKKLKFENESKDDELLDCAAVSEKCTFRETDTKQSNSEVMFNDSKVYKDMPLFYYDLQKKKYSGFPKLDKVIIMLRAAGYRACRTHFEHQAIRTSANGRQLNELMLKLVKK